MTVHGFVVASILIVLTAGASAPALAQSGYEPPRLQDGQPDLQGVWDFRTLTPLQRPEDQESAVLSDEEAAAIVARSAARSAELNAPTERTDDGLPVGGDVGGYNHYWVDQGASVVDDQRTSLLTDPPTGRCRRSGPASSWWNCHSAKIGPARVRCGSARPASAPTATRTAVSRSAASLASTRDRRSCRPVQPEPADLPDVGLRRDPARDGARRPYRAARRARASAGRHPSVDG